MACEVSKSFLDGHAEGEDWIALGNLRNELRLGVLKVTFTPPVCVLPVRRDGIVADSKSPVANIESLFKFLADRRHQSVVSEYKETLPQP